MELLDTSRDTWSVLSVPGSKETGWTTGDNVEPIVRSVIYRDDN